MLSPIRETTTVGGYRGNSQDKEHHLKRKGLAGHAEEDCHELCVSNMYRIISSIPKSQKSITTHTHTLYPNHFHLTLLS